MVKITAVVLAAGGGNRMAPLATNKSKVMLPILGKPVLEYILKNIKEADIKNVIIVVLKKTEDQIKKHFGNNWNGLEITYVSIKETFGPSYALNEAKNQINTPYFLAQYADSLTSENLPQKIIETFSENPKTDGVLAVRIVDDPSRYGIVKYENGQIVGVVDKPGADKSPSNHAVVGTFILKTSMFKKFIKGEKFTLENQLFPAEYLLRNGAKMSSYFFRGQRVDVGKPQDLFNASMLLSKKETKVIAFDADNTLYNTHEISEIADKEAIKILSDKTNKSIDKLYNQWLKIVDTIKDSKEPEKRTRLYSYGALLKNYNSRNLKNKMYETFKKTLIKDVKPMGNIKEILSRLNQEKIIFTEDTKELATEKLKALNILEFFDKIISSSETKIMKPSIKYYEPIYKKYQPEEVLVVGDNYKKDLEIPSKMGSKILFVEDEKSLETLKTLIAINPKRIHIMGAAGAGAAAVAGIAKAYGYAVTACDINPHSAYSKNLKIKIEKGHDPSHIKDIDLLIISPAIEKLYPKNSELLKAKKLNIPTISWQEFQGKYLQKDKFVISIAGAYGKTTTTSMISKIMIDAGLDPTCEVGAEVLEWQNNFKVGKSKYFICESDEYNNNFLNYYPDIAIVLNVDWDHPDFFKTKKSVIESYKKFIANIKPGGSLIIPSTLINSHPELISGSENKIKISGINNFSPLSLSIIGDFREKNADAALTIAQILNIDLKIAKAAVESFKGTGRRLEYKGQIQNVKFYDDYAVQPYTVQTTANALCQKYKNKKVCLVFEPHTFSRVETFFSDFVSALKSLNVESILMTEVYGAREKGDRKTLAEKLANEVGTKAKFTGSLQETANKLRKDLKKFDVVLSMGAGDSYKLFDLIKENRYNINPLI